MLQPPVIGIPGPDEPSSFDATLPDGRRVTPAGVSAQVGQNPLNSVLTEDGRFLLTSNDMERNAPARTGSVVDPLDTKNGADRSLSQSDGRARHVHLPRRHAGIGSLTSLFFQSLRSAGQKGSLDVGTYRRQQDELYQQAHVTVEGG